MKGKQLLLLLLLVVVLGVAGYHLQKGNESSWSNTGGGAGGKVIEFPINDVAQVHVKAATGDVNLVRKNDEWTVQERADYPANFEQVSALLRKLWDMKTVQEVKVGRSQLAKLDLVEPGQGDAAGTLVEFKDKDGKSVGGLLLGKKHMRRTDSPGPMGDMGGFASGRYVAPLDRKKVSLVSETLEEIEAKPERWLRKDFIKVENPKSITVAGATMNWKVTRESTSGEWKFADAGPTTNAADAKPAETKPADNKPAAPASSEPKPATPAAAPPEPADTKPADAKPGEPKPTGGNPCEAPADTKAEAAKPADAPPAPAKPADAATAPAPKPTDGKPAPAATAPTQTPEPKPAAPANPAEPPPPTEPKPAPASGGEQLDKSKLSQFATAFSNPSFKDVLAPDAKPEETGLDKPTVLTIETFDHFTYALSIGKLTNDAYPVRFTVSAELTKERTPGKDEKPEDKTRLDEEFKTTQKRLEEKLAAEKKLEGRVYLLEKYTVEPLLKERSALLVETKPETPAASPSATTAPISVTTPPVSAPPSATTPPISVTTPPVTVPPSAPPKPGEAPAPTPTSPEPLKGASPAAPPAQPGAPAKEPTSPKPADSDAPKL